jgi:hypothetical protein
MTVSVGVQGHILNSNRSGHMVRVEDDRPGSGGYLIFERWRGSDGPNGSGEFDSWVSNEAALAAFFAEAGWHVEWLQEGANS